MMHSFLLATSIAFTAVFVSEQQWVFASLCGVSIMMNAATLWLIFLQKRNR